MLYSKKNNKCLYKYVFLSLIASILILVSCNNYTNAMTNKNIVASSSNIGIEQNTIKNIVSSKSEIATISDINNKNIDRIVFAGDIYINKKNINAYNDGGIDKIIQKDYQKFIDKHDLFFSNLEFCISERGIAADKTYTFIASPSVVNILKEAKIDAVNVANNHTLDFGVDAFLDTLDNLKNANIEYVGGGKNFEEANKTYIKNINGRKYAIITATCVVPSFKWIAKEDTPGLLSGYYGTYVSKAIKKIKESEEQIDKIIIYMHWGKEKELLSNDEQKKLAHAFVDAGADIVIGSHSHTVQEIEYYRNTPIIYSLGNFIFGSTWTETALLSCEFHYGDNEELKIKMNLGISGYEQVRPYTNYEKSTKYNEYILKCINCEYDKNQYIVEKVLKDDEDINNIVNNSIFTG